MSELLAMFSLLALDIFSETKAPCAFVGFDYFTKVIVAIAVPAGIVVVLLVICILHAHTSSGKGHRQRGNLAQLARARARGTVANKSVKGTSGFFQAHKRSAIKHGSWLAAPIALMAIDLLYPAVTRTLLQYFSCRDLGPAGFYLEADCT